MSSTENSLLDINVAHCRARQQRLLAEMQRLRLDLVVVMRIEHVQWLAGPRFGWVHEPAAALWADGRVTLIAPNHPPKVAAADDVATYEAQWTSTLRNDQRQASTEVLRKTLGDWSGVFRLRPTFRVAGFSQTRRYRADAVSTPSSQTCR
jgi:Xaa-Pro dipeptidase